MGLVISITRRMSSFIGKEVWKLILESVRSEQAQKRIQKAIGKLLTVAAEKNVLTPFSGENIWERGVLPAVCTYKAINGTGHSKFPLNITAMEGDLL